LQKSPVFASVVIFAKFL